MHHPTDRITHTTAFVTPVVEHWLERVDERGETGPEGGAGRRDCGVANWPNK